MRLATNRSATEVPKEEEILTQVARLCVPSDVATHSTITVQNAEGKPRMVITCYSGAEDVLLRKMLEDKKYEDVENAIRPSEINHVGRYHKHTGMPYKSGACYRYVG